MKQQLLLLLVTILLGMSCGTMWTQENLARSEPTLVSEEKVHDTVTK